MSKTEAPREARASVPSHGRSIVVAAMRSKAVAIAMAVAVLFIILLLWIICADISRLRLPMSDGWFVAFALAGIVEIAATAAIGALFLLKRYADRLRRQAYIEACRRVGQGDIEARLPLFRPHGPADILAAEVNDMLLRLARLMGFLQEQSDHIRHEYGNSAGRMGVYIDRVREADLPRDAREAFDALDRERRHFLALTDAILNLWRARQGGQRLQQQNLALLIGETVDILEGRAESKNIRVTAHLPETLVFGDAQMLTLLISNLLDNGLKYTPSGGSIEIGCRVENGRAFLTVDDSGPGIPPDLRKEILKPRTRLASSEKGNGYGLAIVDAIVGLHGAKIEISDAAIGGARFGILFPPAEA